MLIFFFNIIRVSKRLEPDPGPNCFQRLSVDPGPYCLQRLSADDTSRQRGNKKDCYFTGAKISQYMGTGLIRI